MLTRPRRTGIWCRSALVDRIVGRLTRVSPPGGCTLIVDSGSVTSLNALSTSAGMSTVAVGVVSAVGGGSSGHWEYAPS